MGRFLTLLVVAAILMTSCKTGVTGIYPYPVRIMKIVNVSTPQQVTAGDTHTLSLEWSGGADTFTVTWTFGGATNQPVRLTTGSERSSSVDITFNLDDVEPGTFNGSVQVVDDRGNQLNEPFSYTVQAQT